MVILRLQEMRFLPLAEGDGEGLAKFAHPLLGELAERLAGLVVDQLHHPDQVALLGVDDGRDQHLLGAVPGPLVDLLQET